MDKGIFSSLLLLLKCCVYAVTHEWSLFCSDSYILRNKNHICACHFDFKILMLSFRFLPLLKWTAASRQYPGFTSWLPIFYNLHRPFLVSRQEMWQCKVVSRHPIFKKWEKSLTPSLCQVEEALRDKPLLSRKGERQKERLGNKSCWRPGYWPGREATGSLT